MLHAPIHAARDRTPEAGGVVQAVRLRRLEGDQSRRHGVRGAAAVPSFRDSGGGQRAERLRSQDRAGFLDATANESFRKAAHRGAMAGAASRPGSGLACQ